MPTRNVVLTEHQSLFVEKLVASGQYQNASEVLREGLRMMEQRETEEAARLEAALLEAENYEQEACRRAEAARELKTALINGVAAGALTLDAQPTTPGVAAVSR